MWIGKHSQRLARAAAWKLASEMSKLPGRPSGIEIRVVRELEETETVGFRHQFKVCLHLVFISFWLIYG